MIKTSEQLIKEEFNLEREDNDLKENFHVVPKISDKILLGVNDMLKNTEFKIDISNVIAVVTSDKLTNYLNSTILVFTGDRVYIKDINKNIIEIIYENINTVNLNDTNLEELNLSIDMSNGDNINISSNDLYESFPFYFFENLLIGLKNKNIRKISTRQFIKFEELPISCKLHYFKIIIHYLRSDDGIIDGAEYKELTSLMAHLKVDSRLSEELRPYRFEENNEGSDELIYNFKKELELHAIDYKNINDALIYSILSMHSTDKLKSWKVNIYLKDILLKLGAKEYKVANLVRMILKQRDMLSKRLDNDRMKDYNKEILALGSAAGVSMLALAATGTITGFGFSMSGALLSLGLGSGGGLLGLAAIAAAGYGTYKGIKYLSGTSILEKYSIQIDALKDKIEVLNKSLSYILDDINYLSEKYKKLMIKFIESETLTEELIIEFQKMSDLYSEYSSIGKEVIEDSNYYTSECLIRELPEKLDLLKFNELVSKSIHIDYYNKIIQNIYVENIENTNEKILKNDVSKEMLEEALNILTEIGYYDLSASVITQTNVAAKKATETIKEGIDIITSNDSIKKGLGGLKSFINKVK